MIRGLGIAGSVGECAWYSVFAWLWCGKRWGLWGGGFGWGGDFGEIGGVGCRWSARPIGVWRGGAVFDFGERARGFKFGLVSGTGVPPVRIGTHRRNARATSVVFVEFEADAAAPVEGVLQPGKFTGEGLQAIEAFVVIFNFLEALEGLGDFIEEPKPGGFVAVFAAILFGDFGFLFGKASVPFKALLVEEPVLVAGASPFGEVLMGDGFAVEVFSEDFFGFREAVDPGQDALAEFAVVEAAVELFADVGGQSGDFA